MQTPSKSSKESDQDRDLSLGLEESEDVRIDLKR